MDKKAIIKKYTREGGTPLTSEVVSNVQRNVTKGNDIVPKETWMSSKFPTPKTPIPLQALAKPRIPYSKTLPTPGPKNLNDVVVPSSRIPTSANPRRPLPEPKGTRMIPNQTTPVNPRPFPPLSNEVTLKDSKKNMDKKKILKKYTGQGGPIMDTLKEGVKRVGGAVKEGVRWYKKTKEESDKLDKDAAAQMGSFGGSESHIDKFFEIRKGLKKKRGL